MTFRDVDLVKVQTPSIYSNTFETDFPARTSKGNLYCQVNLRTNEYQISILSIILFSLNILVCLYLLIKYTSVDYYDTELVPFIIQIVITLIFTAFGIILHTTLVNRELKIEKGVSSLTYISWAAGLAVGGIAITLQGVIQSIRFSIFPTDYYLFFLTVAIAEEILWRFGIQPSFQLLFNFSFKSEFLSRFIPSLIAVILTSALFTLFHIFVYDMINDLLVIFVMGVLFGMAVEMTRRIDVSLIGHVFLNAIAGINFINIYFGGF